MTSFREASEYACNTVGGGPLTEEEADGWDVSPERREFFSVPKNLGAGDYSTGYKAAWLKYIQRVRGRT